MYLLILFHSRTSLALTEFFLTGVKQSSESTGDALMLFNSNSAGSDVALKFLQTRKASALK